MNGGLNSYEWVKNSKRYVMKIAVCDDEIQFLDMVCEMLEDWAEQRKIRLSIHRFTNGDDLILAHQKHCMDLIILDIVMPLLNGLDTAKELRVNDRNVPLIFLTSSREYAIDSYDVRAFHYLIKPVSKERLFAVLDDVSKTIQKLEETFLAQTDMGFCKITIADVEYLEAQNKHVNVFLSNGTSFEIRELFSRCEEVFSLKRGFFKCHRSYIVQLSHVEQFTKTTLLTSHHMTIPISRSSYPAFKETYFNHMFQK